MKSASVRYSASVRGNTKTEGLGFLGIVSYQTDLIPCLDGHITLTVMSLPYFLEFHNIGLTDIFQ